MITTTLLDPLPGRFMPTLRIHTDDPDGLLASLRLSNGSMCSCIVTRHPDGSVAFSFGEDSPDPDWTDWITAPHVEADAVA